MFPNGQFATWQNTDPFQQPMQSPIDIGDGYGSYRSEVVDPAPWTFQSSSLPTILPSDGGGTSTSGGLGQLMGVLMQNKGQGAKDLWGLGKSGYSGFMGLFGSGSDAGSGYYSDAGWDPSMYSGAPTLAGWGDFGAGAGTAGLEGGFDPAMFGGF